MKHSPYNWLEQLNTTIMSTQCRKGSEYVDLEQGCHGAGAIFHNTIEFLLLEKKESMATSSAFKKDCIN